MEDKDKIKSLKKEIEELSEKKKAKDEVNELLQKRNHLKFEKLYGMGRGLKNFWKGVEEWADKKNKQIEENMKLEEQEKKEETKESKTKSEEPVDLYEAMFGEDEMSKTLFGEMKGG
jgi:hypothetical protein